MSDIFATTPRFARCGKVWKVWKKRVSGNKTLSPHLPHLSNPPFRGGGGVWKRCGDVDARNM